MNSVSTDTKLSNNPNLTIDPETGNIVKIKKAPAYRIWVLIVNFLAFGYFFMCLQMTGAFSTQIMSEFAINNAEYGLLTTVFNGIYAIVPLLLGVRLAKHGAKKMTIIGCSITLISTLFFPLGHTYGIMLILRGCQGFGGGLMVAHIIGQTGLWFPKKERGLALGFVLGFLSVGFMLVQAIAPTMLASGMSWQFACAVLSTVFGGIQDERINQREKRKIGKN